MLSHECHNAARTQSGRNPRKRWGISEWLPKWFSTFLRFWRCSSASRDLSENRWQKKEYSVNPLILRYFAHGCGDRCLGYRFHRTGFPERQPYRWHYPEGLPAEFRRKAYTLKALRTYLHGKQTWTPKSSADTYGFRLRGRQILWQCLLKGVLRCSRSRKCPYSLCANIRSVPPQSNPTSGFHPAADNTFRHSLLWRGYMR